MASFLAQRVLSTILLLLFVALVAFALVYGTGDPAVRIVGEGASASDAERIRRLYGLDQPLPVQFGNWLWSALHGDFGRSLYFDRPVTEIIGGRFQVTLLIGIAAIVLALAVAIPFGVAAACFRNTIVDQAALTFAALGQAMPTFWFALVLIVVFSVEFPILPPTAGGTWQSYIMPVAVIVFFASPAILRLTRAGMIAALDSDYIRTARAMALPHWQVVFKYALRNALIPVVSVASAQFGHTLAGSIVIENVFAIGGAGQLAWQSILRADLPVVVALVVCFAAIYTLLILLADIFSFLLDPQIRG